MDPQEKRYNRFSDYLKKKFGKRVIKISLNRSYGCPNMDGTKGYGGCIYCSNSGSGDFAGSPYDTIENQFNNIKNRMKKKWSDGFYLPYFQAYSNSYAPLEVLKKDYQKALSFDNVIGIDIATRADCLEDDVVEYIAQLSKKWEVWVELGLQTIFDKTAKFINRGHNFEEFVLGVQKLRKYNINTCVHIINGLPNETKEMMLQTAKKLNSLDIQGVKIHLLHILKNTKLAKMYQNGEIKPLEKDQYIDIVCDQLEILDPKILIHRVTGDGGRDQLIAPLWSIKKFEVLNGIDWELERRGTKQGDRYE